MSERPAERFSVISDGLPSQLPDVDPTETQEWLDSFDDLVETSGRTRTFRKLYQFVCKGSLIVRTKVSPFPLPQRAATAEKEREKHSQAHPGYRYAPIGPSASKRKKGKDTVEGRQRPHTPDIVTTPYRRSSSCPPPGAVPV